MSENLIHSSDVAKLLKQVGNKSVEVITKVKREGDENTKAANREAIRLHKELECLKKHRGVASSKPPADLIRTFREVIADISTAAVKEELDSGGYTKEELEILDSIYMKK